MKIIFTLLFGLQCFTIIAQVNMQTGSATFTLPIFTWQDDKSRLNSVVALNYNSGNGLKVSDVASNVGEGWNLVAGGVITRMQVGEPDDQYAFPGNGDHSVEDITKYPAGILFANVPASAGCPTALTKYPIYGYLNQVYSPPNAVAEDKQLDYFSFQFNGKSGLFVLDPSNIGATQSLGDSKMKITFQLDAGLVSQGVRTRITSFQIQDVDGLIYKFTLHGCTKVLQLNYCDPGLNQSWTQPTFKSNRVYQQAGFDNGVFAYPWVIDNWFLSEIDDPLVTPLRRILFNYTAPQTISNTAGADVTYNSDKNYSLVSYKKSITTIPELSSIVLPDGHNVAFNPGNARVDLIGEKALSSVDITYQGRYLSKYILNTTYFILGGCGTPVSDYQKSVARLCLQSVQKIGVDLKEDSPPYIFDYYTGSDAPDDFVPPPFFYAKDIWGFYNGNNSKDYSKSTPIPLDGSISRLSNSNLKGLCFLHSGVSGVYFNAKNGYAKNGLLKQIIYPTGGTLTYQYDQNYGLLNSVNTAVGGVHVSQTSSTDGGYSNGCSNPITTLYNYVMNGAGSASSIWGLEMPVNSMTTGNHYKPEMRHYHWTLNSFLLGECYWSYQYPGIASQQQSISLPGLINILNALAPVLDIISIVTTIQDAVTAFTGGSPLALVVDVICEVINVGVTCIGSHSRNNPATVYYNTDLNAVAPLPTQFKRVEVVENSGTIGKTMYEFTNSDDYAIWEPQNTAFAAKQRFAPWAYGLPKRVAVIDKNGFTVKETVNEYNFNTKYTADGKYFCDIGHYDRSLLLKKLINIASCKCKVNNSASQNSADYSGKALSYIPDGNISIDPYFMYTGRSELNNTRERTYKPGNNIDYLETLTSYAYNDENYEVSLIKTVKSDGKITQKNVYYTIDYVKVHGTCYDLSQTGTTNPELKALVNNNIIGLPVETSTMIFDPQSSGNNYLNDQATIFTTLSNGDIKPSKIIEGRFNSPARRNSLWQEDYANKSYYFPQPLYDPASPDYSFYKTSQTFAYDAAGNLTGLTDEGARMVTNIYDYQDKYVVASVVNANPGLDKPAYSSFESTGFGGWLLTGSGPAYFNGGITGASSFILNGNTLTAPSLSAKPYVLSFWANSSSVMVSGGATLTKSAPAINGFTYYEYAIAQGTSNVSVSGNAVIDELRLYPKTARMRTVTYDPLIGKTSECDENNRITYYEYDNLGRLRFIKDENSNIVKMYEYNTVSAAKQNGCPGIYYNHPVSEVFTRSDCGAGYIRGSWTYTKPANIFSSSLSQADADAKAEHDVLTYGQSGANKNGSCILLIYNTLQSKSFATKSCGIGYTGGDVTYTVPANRYFSTISLDDANQIALDEIAANGPTYANVYHKNCTINLSPEWDADETAASKCEKDANGSFTGHFLKNATDINPYSPTYGTHQYKDMGADEATCPPTKGSPPSLNGTGYSSADGSGVVTGAPGTILSVNVTLNSSDAGASLSGYVGANVQINGSGNHTVTNTVTIPAIGYISWSLKLTGNLGTGGGYISSNITFQ